MVVYKITNLLNNKPYVGQTRQSIEKRFYQHAHANSPLGNAMRQCGLENFTIEVIERCDTQEQLDTREKFWIRALNCMTPNGYNQSLGGERGHINRSKNRTKTVSAGVNRMEIPTALKRFRQSLKLSQRQLSEKIGVPYQSYQTYEYGTSTPSAKVIVRIAQAFDVSTDYLLGLSDTPRPPDTSTLLAAINDAQKILSDALDKRSE
ncbi:MAG: helix-turn-helix domain-containing protein [Selenomonadaceae bacterium]|nr:helix-turn-helix domain-containing protein [Selenomonadaceae bacterium]MBR1805807.1 helix-turn-helix domain-containing protein [Selenomonadaceae bacterium]